MVDTIAFHCRTCGSSSKRTSYTVREMMFGTKGEFAYDQCDSCESIQITTIPKDDELSAYYPSNYYSFGSNLPTSLKEKLRSFVKKEHDRGLLCNSLAGRFIESLRPDVSTMSVIKATGIRQERRILDVGCGAGAFLDRLARIGFRNLAGIDPFLSADCESIEGVPLYKRRLSKAAGPFDVILFNHAFEHVPDPAAELEAARQKLEPKGVCLIQMPTPTSDAFREYGTDWAQWDAPRHLTLMSRKGMSIFASNRGFKLQRVIDLALPWSLMASELCKRGIPFGGVPLNKHFSRSEIAGFQRRTTAANAAGRGDAVSYVLVRS